MISLTKEIVTSEKELKEYRNLVQKNIGVLFPITYLKQGIVRAFKNGSIPSLFQSSSLR